MRFDLASQGSEAVYRKLRLKYRWLPPAQTVKSFAVGRFMGDTGMELECWLEHFPSNFGYYTWPRSILTAPNRVIDNAWDNFSDNWEKLKLSNSFLPPLENVPLQDLVFTSTPAKELLLTFSVQMEGLDLIDTSEHFELG